MIQSAFIVGTIIFCVVLFLLAFISLKIIKAALNPSDALLNEKLCEKVVEFKEDIKEEVKKDICEEIAVNPDSKLFTGTRWDK